MPNPKLTTAQRNAQRKRYYRKHSKGKINARRRWEREDDLAVMSREDNDVSLSLSLSRSVMAIQLRRCKLKKRRPGSECL